MTRPASRRPMEPFDTLMYRTEDDPRIRSSMMSAFILDRAPEWDRLRYTFERITREVVALRQRVVEPMVPITAAQWVVDPDFDLNYHLRRVRVPGAGTERDLLDVMEPILMMPLDRARPLWEVTLVSGLKGGRAALVFKMNHAITDGAGGQQLAMAAIDLEREPHPPREMPSAPVPDDVSPYDLIREAAGRTPVTLVTTLARAARRTLGAGSQAIQNPGRALNDTGHFLSSLGRVLGPSPAEPSPLLRRRGLRRRLETLEIDMEALRSGSKAGGGSLNDGLLAAVAGGLRRYHEKLGAPIDSMCAAVAISLRTEDDPAASNRFAGARLRMPIAEEDPVERIRLIHDLVRRARDEPAIDALRIFAPFAVLVPKALTEMGTQLAGPTHDIQISNVPGSPIPLYLAGSKIQKMLYFGPLPGPAAMLVLHSYVSTCYLGVNLDPAAIVEADLFMDCIQQGFEEIVGLAQPKA